MNPRLKRIVEDIDKMETKIAEWQTQVKELKRQRKQLEDQEIIKTVRAMQLSDAELLRMLYGIQNGTICLADVTATEADEKNNMNSGKKAAESEDSTDEKVD